MSLTIEPLIGAIRPIQLKGKGFVFTFVTPRSGMRNVRVWGDYAMTLNLANVIHRQIFMGCFGRYMTACTRALLPVGGTFLDVGAHAGYFTLLAAHCVGPSGKVLALEPTPPTFGALQNHLRANAVTNVQAHMIALSEANGSLRLYIPPAGETRDYNVTCVPRSDWIAIDVPCRRLDEFLIESKIDHINLMKMDVEGAEPRVLTGAVGPLKRGVVKHLIVEVNGPRLSEAGSNPAKLVDQLSSLGFIPAQLSGKRAVPVPINKWDLHPDHEYDRLFMHNQLNEVTPSRRHM